MSNPLTTSVRARSHCRCNYAFPILYLGEISTFFSACELRIACSTYQVYASSLFASTFFSRIVTFGLLVVRLFSQWRPDAPIINSSSGLIPILLPALYCLNCYWFYKIFQSVLRVFQGGSASASVTRRTYKDGVGDLTIRIRCTMNGSTSNVGIVVLPFWTARRVESPPRREDFVRCEVGCARVPEEGGTRHVGADMSRDAMVCARSRVSIYA